MKSCKSESETAAATKPVAEHPGEPAAVCIAAATLLPGVEAQFIQAIGRPETTFVQSDHRRPMKCVQRAGIIKVEKTDSAQPMNDLTINGRGQL